MRAGCCSGHHPASFGWHPLSVAGGRMAPCCSPTLVATSAAVAATRSRKAKVAALAELLARVEPEELEVVVSYLGGALRQRRTGSGLARRERPAGPATEPSLTVLEVDGAFEAMSRSPAPAPSSRAGGGRATSSVARPLTEQAWLRGVVTGNVRQGALDAVTQEAVAQVAGVPLAAVRRAAMLAGSTVAAAGAAFDGARRRWPRSGSRSAGRSCRCSPRARPTSRRRWPGCRRRRTEVAIDAKLDGIRIQVHRDGDEVLRRDPQPRRHHRPAARGRGGRAVAAGDALRARRRGARPRPTTAARGLPGHREPHRPGHRCRPSRLTSSTCSTSTAATCSTPPATSGSPRSTRWSPSSTAYAAAGHRRRRRGRRVRRRDRRRRARRRGPQGPRRRPTPPVAAARRGSRSSRVHTLDLVVLAVEWGSGRREGWLSNIHLGARDAASRRLRDARQDVQGHDRRDARLADRALHRARDSPTARATSSRSGPSRWWRSRSTASSAPRATPAASRCASPGSSATATTRAGRGRHDRDRCARTSRREPGGSDLSDAASPAGTPATSRSK